jgi:hypothetical protein
MFVLLTMKRLMKLLDRQRARPRQSVLRRNRSQTIQATSAIAKPILKITMNQKRLDKIFTHFPFTVPPDRLPYSPRQYGSWPVLNASDVPLHLLIIVDGFQLTIARHSDAADSRGVRFIQS